MIDATTQNSWTIGKQRLLLYTQLIRTLHAVRFSSSVIMLWNTSLFQKHLYGKRSRACMLL